MIYDYTLKKYFIILFILVIEFIYLYIYLIIIFIFTLFILGGKTDGSYFPPILMTPHCAILKYVEAVIIHIFRWNIVTAVRLFLS